MLMHTGTMLRSWGVPGLCLLVAACSQQPARDYAIGRDEVVVPVNLNGSWERDYSRGDDVNKALGRLFRRLSREMPDQRNANNSRVGAISPSLNISSIVALARLADAITRPSVLTISQSEREITIEREGDFAMVCEFYDGVARGPSTDYGTEVCGWDGHQFISRLILPDGLRVSHRFTVAPGGENMHVATTVSSSATRVPFTLNRFYARFEPPESDYNCIETLSRKRVCSTGEVSP